MDDGRTDGWMGLQCQCLGNWGHVAHGRHEGWHSHGRQNWKLLLIGRRRLLVQDPLCVDWQHSGCRHQCPMVSSSSERLLPLKAMPGPRNGLTWRLQSIRRRPGLCLGLFQAPACLPVPARYRHNSRVSQSNQTGFRAKKKVFVVVNFFPPFLLLHFSRRVSK